MGYLKDMLEQAIKAANVLDETSTESYKLFTEYKRRFTDSTGQPMIWKTSTHPDLKQPQLVVVEYSYQYFVTVIKVVYNVEAELSRIRHAINYASLYSGADTIEFLDIGSVKMDPNDLRVELKK